MKIIVVGCGKVGETIVRQLSKERHDISIVDTDVSVVTDITNGLDVMGVVGNGASYDILEEARIEEADLLIAVTDSDELNLLCCLLAKQVAGCSTIARVRNPVYSEEIGLIKEELGLSMTINPEYAAAREIARILRVPSAIRIEAFAKGKVELMKISIPEKSILHDLPVSEVGKKTDAGVLICAVERGSEVLIPNGQFVLQAGDKISIIAPTEKTRQLFHQIGVESPRVRNAMIVGGGKIAYYLARQLKLSGIEVTIIENNLERCEELSEILPGAVIIHGDASSQSLLMEEGIVEADAFVTLTGIDEENIFLSLFARSCSRAKIVTKINKLSFDNIINGFELGSVIYPKNITADNIVRYVRAMQNSLGSNVETLYNIIENRVEALEFLIKDEAEYVGVPLSRLNIRENVLIAAVSRGGDMVRPDGNTQIQIGDSVIAVTTQTGVGDFRDLLND